jgi:hypothetical protein
MLEARGALVHAGIVLGFGPAPLCQKANGWVFDPVIVGPDIIEYTLAKGPHADFLGDAGNYAISLFVVGMALRYRAMAAFLKGATMGVFGLWC